MRKILDHASQAIEEARKYMRKKYCSEKKYKEDTEEILEDTTNEKDTEY